ncbi:Peptidoglycan glycosyltransferase FtsW [Planctomycetes bacterium Pla163]|uniref:Probable peptidoglycan glycosyltransferase FtsW n=1 Tax=Rohdeia mirabilis TaxID=2528008 RepID=A0A518CYQ8_9BACT|nr:Peptidoglycan glycosyltransferase FtsW [Planctomycetes bacterium Pla163]
MLAAVGGGRAASTAVRGEGQLDFGGFLDRMGERDVTGPARGLFGVVLALLGAGFLLQVGHAATVMGTAEFHAHVVAELVMRALAIVVILVAARIGPSGLRPFLPLLVTLSLVALFCVFVPGIGVNLNGARRWIHVGISVQPSEVARVVLILWLAHYCVALGPRIDTVRRGLARMMGVTMTIAGLVLVQPDLGGTLVLLICACATMWTGGVATSRVALPFFGLSVGAFALAVTGQGYVSGRLAMWLDRTQNAQVNEAVGALATSGPFGAGYTGGVLRNLGFSYQNSDFAFSFVGEELGWAGVVGLIALLVAFLWYGARVVLAVRDRFDAVCAFGLTLSVAFQAVVHVGVVSGLMPPKGMTLPFLSSGGTSLLVSSLTVGLVLGAARRTARRQADDLGSADASTTVHAPTTSA